MAWFRGLAASGFPQTSVGGGFAVSTGLASNTENGAVISPSLLDNPHELDALLGWLRKKAVPAAVLPTGPVEPEATVQLVDRQRIAASPCGDLGPSRWSGALS